MKRFLFVNPFGLGDVLFTFPLVRALRAAFPESEIGFVCNERTEELVRLHTAVDHTYVFHRDHFRKLWSERPFQFFLELRGLMGLIRKRHYEVLFDLSLGREYSFFAWCLGIPRRIGFDFKKRGIFLTHKIRLEGYESRPVTAIQSELLRFLSLSPAPEDTGSCLRLPDSARSLADEFLARNGIPRGSRFFAVSPGGGESWGPNASYKQWDADRFARVAEDVAARTKAVVLFVGSRGEKKLLEQAAARCPARSVIAAGLPLGALASLLERCDALLGNDGGLMHLGHALGVKTLTIFGPVDETVYRPFGGDAQAAVATQAVPCRPCYRHFHFPPCRHERRCLTELAVENVMTAARSII